MTIRYASFGAILASLLALAACSGGDGRAVPAVPGSGNAASFQAAASGAIGISPADAAAASGARILHYHLMPLRTAPARGSTALAPDKLVYPADLTRSGGPVMKTAASYNVYVDCPTPGESCWGAPEAFQTRLATSAFAQLLAQYTGAGPGAYSLGKTFTVNYQTFTHLLYSNDLLEILHAALVKNGKKHGYASMYHIFLPKGMDTCFDLTRACYSPDRPALMGFCAYHEVVNFPDVAGNVIVTIEPYQKVVGCASLASSGASALTNSTVSTLAHETFESITDPGPPLAWFNFTFGSEIGDLCETYQWKIPVRDAVYSIQPMYSNKYHACAAGP